MICIRIFVGLVKEHRHGSLLGICPGSRDSPIPNLTSNTEIAPGTQNTNLGSIKLPALTRSVLGCRFSQVPHVIGTGNTANR
jgi:hypothetical protein